MISRQILEKLEFFKIVEYISKYASTENGKKRVESLNPLNDKNEILKMGNYISEAKDILIKNDSIPLVFLPDLNEALSRSTIEGSVLSQKSISDILTLAETSRKLYTFFKSRGTDYSLWHNLANSLFVDKTFEHHLSSVFGDDGNEISDNASSKLRDIRKEIRKKGDQLRKVVSKILKQLSESFLVQEEYMTQRDGRIVLPVKAEHKRHVRGFIHSESATGQTVYIEPEETLELNNEILSMTFAEKREIERILQSLTKIIGSNSNELKKSLRVISEIDAIFAEAKYSIEIIGSFPSFIESKPFHILNARHPILIKKLGRDGTVALDLKIGSDKVIIITGPNAGGKTVVLKTTGLLMSMALSGLHIPAAADSNLYFFNNILLDIGDEQSIEDDLSTFSSHLSNINNILKQADENSLVLLDEIGTGTDPAEGAALATALLISLKKSNAIVLATTHHGILKILANDIEGFQNSSMEFDIDNLAPTYKFHQGLPGSSYAFEVAGRIGFDDNFIELAKKNLDTDKNKIETFLVQLESKSQKYQEKLNSLEIENTRLSGLTNLYKKKIDELEKQKRDILEKARAKAEYYLKDVNKKVESAIKNIRESNASREVIVEEKSNIRKLKKVNEEIIDKELENKPAQIYSFESGDYAKLKNMTAEGIVSEIDKTKNKAILLSGNIKLQVKLSELVPAKKSNIRTSSDNYNYQSAVVNARLDIRGMKPEEAEYDILRYLDDAFASNIDRVEILHGKGTGALKKTVHNILINYDNVKNYYFAKVEFGGEGITVVEFK